MTALTNADTKYWAPVPEIVTWLANRLPQDARVLEIGPGFVPFPRANEFVDLRDLPNLPGPCHKIDLTHDRLPFDDKAFDFIYCRHVLEDMYDPFPLCAEMSRVAKAGYIETPSPLAELCRGIDGNSPPYRGYHHHRWVVWADHHPDHFDHELRFVSKFPLIEYADVFEPAPSLRDGPKFWNTHYLWRNEIKLRHIQCPQDFDIVTGYAHLLRGATACSQMATKQFWQALEGAEHRRVF